ncbi:MAG TPA: winged helix-turn-helix domain-containing protein [Terriglobales bacterium]|jgi:DNA-binding winged helix-turn-helix (wHTH) protein/Tol biopolymer transport system component|nr:winged helix-turn-helix domain-containing protein [Terriglobales bacterium]
MIKEGSTGTVIRFGAFEANLRSGELRKQGVRLKLGDQPFSVLTILLAQAGEVVTRDDLQKQLWPTDTFVDFDRGLNKAINRLRDALGDSADAPRFIETLPKRGYRFIGIVDPPASPPIVPPITASVAAIPDKRVAKRTRETIIVALVLIACIVVWWLMRTRQTPAGVGPITRSSLLPPPHTAFVAYSFALSPSGNYLAFVAETPDGSRSLWIRTMSTASATVIAGTADASFPFWSPDDRRVGFFADRKLKSVDLAGGAIHVVADVRRASGGTWGNRGVIVFAPDVNGPLYQVADTGGTPTPIGRVADSDGLRGNRWPVFLPDGRHFLYVAFAADLHEGAVSEIRAGALDSPDDKHIASESIRTVAFALNHLFFVRRGVLYAQPFDTAQLRTAGEPVAVTDRDVAGPSVFYPSEFSISVTGMLAFQSSTDLASHLVWFGSTGQEISALRGIPYFDPAFSPDGRMLAGSCDQSNNGMLTICVQDLARGVTTRVTGGTNDRFPVWAPDGRAVAYSSNGAIYRIPADGSGTPILASNHGIPTGWTYDGRILSFGTHRGVVSLALSSFTARDSSDMGPGAEGQLSPDTAWMAYIRDGLVIRRFPEPGQCVQVTGYGASQPRWSRNGRQLFFIGADKKLMVVDFDPTNATVSAVRVLAQTRIIASSLTGFQYDVAADGRFLVNSLDSDAAPLTLMTGWADRLRR